MLDHLKARRADAVRKVKLEDAWKKVFASEDGQMVLNDILRTLFLMKASVT